MSRTSVLTDAKWERIRPFLPSSDGKTGRAFRDDRPVVESILYHRAGSPGTTSRSSLSPGRRCGGATAATAATGPGTRSWPPCSPTRRRFSSSTGRCQGVPPSTALTSTPPTSPATQGEQANYTNLRLELADHAVGRSLGGLSTKIHALVDGAGRPLVVLVGPGQGGDSPMYPHLMGHLRVRGGWSASPRTRPDRLRAGKAYSFRAIRAHLRARGITAVIPEPADQQGHRTRRGSRGGRPPAFDAEDYKGRNVVERSFNLFKQWRGLATRYDKLALTYRGGAVLRAITIWLKALLGDMP